MTKKLLSLVLVSLLGWQYSFAQEEGEEPSTDNRPARPAFESGYLIDNQTVSMYPAKTLEFVIHHRFGTTENGISDLWGLYSTSNVRLGLNYTLNKRIMLGIGTTRNKKYQDLLYKVKILEQTRSGSMPVSLTWYGNVAIDARAEEAFGVNYKFTNRLSYYNQLMIGKRFNDRLSLQVAPGFAHFNSVDSLREHDVVNVGISGRFKFSPQSSIILHYNLPVYFESMQENKDLVKNDMSKYNCAIGWEICTSTHAFQIFLGTSTGILDQESALFNYVGVDKTKWGLGFNITRLWNF